MPQGSDKRRRGAIHPRDASWLLVLGAARDRYGRCWLRVRLPSRPNDAAAWLFAGHVELRPTRWRIVVNRSARSLSVYRSDDRLRRFRVVVGAPSTPTPRGLFSIVGVWRWNPVDFLGSYILPITAHSNVLQEFGGGDGRVGIHGRGAHSLLDPLGAARSHGCVRLSNRAIEWLVRRVGAHQLPGFPSGCDDAARRARSEHEQEQDDDGDDQRDDGNGPGVHFTSPFGCRRPGGPPVSPRLFPDPRKQSHFMPMG